MVTEDIVGDGFDDVILYNPRNGTSYMGLWRPSNIEYFTCLTGQFSSYTYAYWGEGGFLVHQWTINTSQ